MLANPSLNVLMEKAHIYKKRVHIGNTYICFSFKGRRVFAMNMTLAMLNGMPVIWDAAYLDTGSSQSGYLARRIEKQVKTQAKTLFVHFKCVIRKNITYYITTINCL